MSATIHRIADAYKQKVLRLRNECAGDPTFAHPVFAALYAMRASHFPDTIQAIGPELMISWADRPTQAELKRVEVATGRMGFRCGTHAVGDGGFSFSCETTA